MDILRAILGIFVVIFLAFVLGLAEMLKNPAQRFYIWAGAIVVLLLMRFFL